MLAMRLCHLVSLLLLDITRVLSNPATHVYEPECAPPDSATPSPPAATTTTNPNAIDFYPGVLPIEYCCPQKNSCKKWGGICALRWLLATVLPDCDYYEEEACRDYGCQCCIKCSRDKCSKCVQHGGNCRVKCRSDEIRDHFKKCDYYKCSCCKKCEMLDECAAVNGTCRANHYDCPAGTAASPGCCGGCTCCRPELQKDFSCERKQGSYCALREEDCVEGYYACFGECEGTQFYNGLESKVVGYCCAPKNAGSGGVGRIGQLDYDIDEDGMELLESENLDNLAPRPIAEDKTYGNAAELVEDKIYNEVVPIETPEEPAFDKIQNKFEDVIEEQVDEVEANNAENIEEAIFEQETEKEANLQEDMLYDEFAPQIENSDTNAYIDTPMDIPDQLFDNPQVIDSPISDDTIASIEQVDENNKEVERPKHHRRHKKN